MPATRYCIASLSHERAGDDWTPQLLFWNRHQSTDDTLFRHRGKAWDPTDMSFYDSEEAARAEIDREKLVHGVPIELKDIEMDHVVRRVDNGLYLHVRPTPNNQPPEYVWAKTPARLREMTAEVALMSCGVGRGFLERQIRVSQSWLEKHGAAIQARMLGANTPTPAAPGQREADVRKARAAKASVDQIEIPLDV